MLHAQRDERHLRGAHVANEPTHNGVGFEHPAPSKDLAAVIVELQATIAELRAQARLHVQEKRLLATENLMLLHRARKAEEKLADRERELEELRSKIVP
jgi:hypothetical protein